MSESKNRPFQNHSERRSVIGPGFPWSVLVCAVLLAFSSLFTFVRAEESENILQIRSSRAFPQEGVGRRSDRGETTLNGLRLEYQTEKKGFKEQSILTVQAGRATEGRLPENWKSLWTPLHTAAAFGDHRTIREEVRAGKDINSGRNNFLTPLHVAAILANTDSVRILLQEGANPIAKDWTGLTAAEAGQEAHPSPTSRFLAAATAAAVLCHEKKEVVLSHRGTTYDLTEPLQRIAKGKRDGHRNDGTEFFNHERKIPARPKYYYTEFVHRVTNDRSPGARRIVIGCNGDIWYTPDHYSTFIPVNEKAEQARR